MLSGWELGRARFHAGFVPEMEVVQQPVGQIRPGYWSWVFCGRIHPEGYPVQSSHLHEPENSKEPLTFTARLVNSHHGFQDFDIDGHPVVRRACVPNSIKKGEHFNVYHGKARSRALYGQGRSVTPSANLRSSEGAYVFPS